MSHEEEVHGPLVWGHGFRNVSHQELNCAETVISAFGVKENVFWFTKTTTIYRLLGEANSRRNQLASDKVIQSVPEIKGLVLIESGLNGSVPSEHPFRRISGRDVHGSAQLQF
jgi:hypothetical protein